MRLLGAGEEVVDVPPKLSARARVSATDQGRKTDATDAHSVALVGTRMTGLRPHDLRLGLAEARSHRDDGCVIEVVGPVVTITNH
jgi:hypothetical protein